jgi:2-methylaconitate cis-trans-isomerase PrpF
MQIKIPCVVMRGGTSRGLFFQSTDLPADIETRDKVILAAMGSPHVLQVDGMGGGHPNTSKVAIVGRSTHDWAQIDYLFAQVAVDRAWVDTNPPCGNILSGVGPFAIESGLIPAQDGETCVRVLDRNTGFKVEAYVQTPGGRVEYEGNAAIDGVAGTAAPIKLNFLEAMGAKTGALFPTGKRREEIDGVPVTLIDYAQVMMLVAASSVGIRGNETPDELEAIKPLREKIEKMRLEAGRRMGFGDVSEKLIPKIGILSKPTGNGTITSRVFTPERCHKSHPVTGGTCIATASRVPGTVAFDLARPGNDSTVSVEHPKGQLGVDLQIDLPRDESTSPNIHRAAVIRTARKLFEGGLFVPSRTWPARTS